MASQSYAFRRMMPVDLPTVRQWLGRAHVAEWWGDPSEQFKLVSEDLAHPSIDQFIGEEDMIERGQGSGFVRAFADRLLAAGVPQVLTDASPANAPAIKAYEKAGFCKLRSVDAPNGAALLMVRHP